MRTRFSLITALLLSQAPAAFAQPDYDTTDDFAVYAEVSTAPIGNDVPDVSMFYDRLGANGSWYDDAAFGYVFTPADPSFVPYSNGHWKLTDYGWTWISGDSFGWATDHYGRWVYRGNRWIWRPDTTWGPAWVAFRYGDPWVGCLQRPCRTAAGVCHDHYLGRRQDQI